MVELTTNMIIKSLRNSWLCIIISNWPLILKSWKKFVIRDKNLNKINIVKKFIDLLLKEKTDFMITTISYS